MCLDAHSKRECPKDSEGERWSNEESGDKSAAAKASSREEHKHTCAHGQAATSDEETRFGNVQQCGCAGPSEENGREEAVIVSHAHGLDGHKVSNAVEELVANA